MVHASVIKGQQQSMGKEQSLGSECEHTPKRSEAKSSSLQDWLERHSQRQGSGCSERDPMELNDRLMRSKLSIPRKATVSSVRIRMFSMLHSTKAEMVSGGLTFLSFVLILMETDMTAQKEQVPDWLIIGNSICLTCFFVELMLHLYVERRAAIKDVWNWLDATVVLSALANLALDMFSAHTVLGPMRILRCLRLVRILKALSLIKHAQHLRSLVRSIGVCLRLLFWSALIVFIFMTMWSTLAVQMLQPHMADVAAKNTGAWVGCVRCARSFDTVMAANLTLFQTIIAGDSWGLVAIPVIEALPWAAIIFVGSLFTIAIGVLNLVVAILVDAAATARANDIEMRSLQAQQTEDSEKHNLSKIFKQMDQDQNGGLSFEELMDGSQRIAELSQMLKTMDIQTEELYQLFLMLDEDQSGEVDPDEFIDKIYRLKCGDNKTAATFVKHYVLHLKQNQHEMLQSLEKLEDRMQVNTKLLRKFAKATKPSDNHSSSSHASSEFQLLRSGTMDFEVADATSIPAGGFTMDVPKCEPKFVPDSSLDNALNWGVDLHPQRSVDFNPPLEGHNMPLKSPQVPICWTPRRSTKPLQLCTPRSPLGPLGLITPKQEDSSFKELVNS